MNKLVIAGVPEQVNIPIKICIERGIFPKYGIDVEYKIVPEGTGAMLNQLESGSVDVALLVTDSFIVGKASGRAVELVGVYVETPLIWAIAASPLVSLSSFDELIDLRTKIRIGISRVGSGSQTIAFYLCKQKGLDTSRIEFVVANNITGLLKGIQEDLFDIFLWETSTTQPLFNRSELKKLGEVSAPWPAFSIVSGQKVEGAQERHDTIKQRLLPALIEGIDLFLQEVNVVTSGMQPTSILRISEEFGSTFEEATAWVARTKYALPGLMVKTSVFAEAVSILKQAGLVSEEFLVSDLWGASNSAITFINE